ncbi:MAG: hypothetical protein JWN76_2051 [Chitinophagaceae bacterium]|nr:hypothetical protein [Chitinophagaceae bacterium]
MALPSQRKNAHKLIIRSFELIRLTQFVTTYSQPMRPV